MDFSINYNNNSDTLQEELRLNNLTHELQFFEDPETGIKEVKLVYNGPISVRPPNPKNYPVYEGIDYLISEKNKHLSSRITPLLHKFFERMDNLSNRVYPYSPKDLLWSGKVNPKPRTGFRGLPLNCQELSYSIKYIPGIDDDEYLVIFEGKGLFQITSNINQVSRLTRTCLVSGNSMKFALTSKVVDEERYYDELEKISTLAGYWNEVYQALKSQNWEAGAPGLEG